MYRITNEAPNTSKQANAQVIKMSRARSIGSYQASLRGYQASRRVQGAMINFVKMSWTNKTPESRPGRLNAILRDGDLSWCAIGLACHLTTQKNGVRFPNSIFDGTMDALEELERRGYIIVVTLVDD